MMGGESKVGPVTSDLLDHNINLVAVLHVELLGSLGLVEALAIEEESNITRSQLNEGVLRSVVGNRHP